MTVFTTPVPLRVGLADISVLVERAQTPVLDARVNLTLARAGEPAIQTKATHALATNQLLYAARVTLSSPGTWRIKVQVNEQEVEGTIEVLPEQQPAAAYWPYFAAVPALVLLFGLNQWLKRKRRAPHREARP